MLKNIRIRHKLLLSYSIVLILSISLGSGFIYMFVRKKLTTALESELKNTTTAILNMVRTAAAVSIKNHLRAVAEKDREIVSYFHHQARQGLISEAEARTRAANVLLSQRIGDSGYIYCLDSTGKVAVHPQKPLINTNVSDFTFVREQLARKEGYIEYNWKNPDEAVSRPKALYMVYFAPWDWIISASTYRNEFNSLVNVGDFRKSILDLRFGKTGYSFVIDGNGKAIIHPLLQGINILETHDLPNQFVMEMQRRKSGKIIYPWKNPGEATARDKLVIFNHIPEYDWIVASSSYLDEFYAPLRTIRTLVIATAFMTFLLVLPISLRIGASITTPLQRLMHHFDRMVAGDFSARMVPASRDEIGQLAVYYNRFADEIEHSRDDLQKQVTQCRLVEEALRESEARYRSVMEAAPDPIVVYDMQGRVIYFNPAFTRFFGWPLDACQGKKLDHFVPDENWEETNRMIASITAGKRFASIQTRRYTAARALMDVSISGETYRDSNGELAGSVVILRDITKSQQLQTQVMEIGDSVRRRIGQDLHDDLCPHLIGVQGLSTVLAENLRDAAPANLPLAEKVVELMASAIDKSRSLARGLCPVHLVSHGLAVALEDMARQTEAVFGHSCRYQGDEKVVVADNTVATHLYYIAQEAVQNAVKHSNARHIRILLAEKGGHLHLRVIDDGNGIPDPVEPSGIGLQIMHYRANIIGAAFQITSKHEAGTTVHVFLKPRAIENRQRDRDGHDNHA